MLALKLMPDEEVVLTRGGEVLAVLRLAPGHGAVVPKELARHLRLWHDKRRPWAASAYAGRQPDELAMWTYLDAHPEVLTPSPGGAVVPLTAEACRLRSERESGLACRNVTPSGRPACMALPLDGCPCCEAARNAGEVGRGE
jgi:hypothetical protein